mgnify:CR=1 FL=1
MEYPFLASIIGIMSLGRHGTVKRSLEMKMVMRFTEVKEKIIKNKAINSTDKVKGRHRRVIRIGAFA